MHNFSSLAHFSGAIVYYVSYHPGVEICTALFQNEAAAWVIVAQSVKGYNRNERDQVRMGEKRGKKTREGYSEMKLKNYNYLKARNTVQKQQR